MLWDQTYYDGTPTTNRVYYQKSLTAMVQQPSDPTQPPSWWAVTSANGINDNGAIIGLANFTQIPYAPVQHGVLLLPCQFRLLNGDTNAADVDGQFFDGSRPTTFSATIPYATEDVVNSVTNAGQVVDQLGLQPFCNTLGKSDAYVVGIEMTAKVASTNVVFGWDRIYWDACVTISKTSSNTWYVNLAPPGVTGPIEDNPNSLGTDRTVVPSTNNSAVVFCDAPGMALHFFTGGATNINDFAYEKTDFLYSLTNSVGATNVVATINVGQIIVAKRIALTGTNADDWLGESNIISTTNIPNCATISTNEIKAIVYPSTNPIIFDPSVPSSP